MPRFLPSDTTLGFEGWSGRSTRVRCVAYLLVVWLRAAPLSSHEINANCQSFWRTVRCKAVDRYRCQRCSRNVSLPRYSV